MTDIQLTKLDKIMRKIMGDSYDKCEVKDDNIISFRYKRVKNKPYNRESSRININNSIKLLRTVENYIIPIVKTWNNNRNIMLSQYGEEVYIHY